MSLRYLADSLTLRPITQLGHEQQLEILSIRNQPEVRNKMYTSHVISEQEHQRWLARLSENDSTRFFVVFLADKIIGGVSLNAISIANRRADWAYYLDTAQQGHGIGPALEYVFLNHVFDTIGLNKLNCEVLDFNAAVISLHKKFGFVEEGIRREHIRLQDGVFDSYLNAHLLGITRDEWTSARQVLQERLFR